MTSLTYVLFRYVSLMTKYWGFSNLFLELISSSVPLWLDNIFYLYLYKSAKVSFTAWNAICLGECLVSVRRVCTLLLLKG